MPSGLSQVELSELTAVFVRELQGRSMSVRAAYARLTDRPLDEAALTVLRDFFHTIAGTARSVGMAELGAVCSIAQRIAGWVMAGAVPIDKARPAFADALTVIEGVLNGQAERPAFPPPDVVAPKLVVSPATQGLERVLIIDDDLTSARLIDGVLRRAGFVSSYCCKPELALSTIHGELPDLIILDVVMPVFDGFELCRKVRAHPALQLTPIIFVTGSDDVAERVRGLEAGGNDYIAKPFESEELVARVRSHIDRLAALRDMAVRDGLTRCFNHKYFKTRLEQEIARSQRYGNQLAVAMLDIDYFKKVNDEHGHPVGDQVLSQTASRILGGVRLSDVVARYGGEEFGVLLLQAGCSEALTVTERIRVAVAGQPFIVQSQAGARVSLDVSLSIGVAQLEAAEQLPMLLGRADAALYRAKQEGRNRVVVSPPPSGVLRAI